MVKNKIKTYDFTTDRKVLVVKILVLYLFGLAPLAQE